MVSILSCENYDYENMLKVVKETFDNLGGIEKYIKKGEKVLLKVNLVMKKAPEEAATTHPALAYALAKTLVDYGAEVTIGDSPGGPFSETLLKGMYKHSSILTQHHLLLIIQMDRRLKSLPLPTWCLMPIRLFQYANLKPTV